MATAAPANGSLSPAPTAGLSSDEMALYDRQIRLWGAQAQERIRSANILLISLRALGTEVAKSLTLAGVCSLTIVDDEPVKEDDVGVGQFFLRAEDVGKPRAEAALPRIQDLNPRVSVKSAGGLQTLLMQDPTFYTSFDCVIALDHDSATLSLINTAVRFVKRPFYAGGIHGFYGYIFADLVLHDYIIEREKSNMPTVPRLESLTRSITNVSQRKEPNGTSIEIVKKQEMYCPLILANTAPLPPDTLSNRRKLKAVPALLPCLRALFDFEVTFGRAPNHTGADIATFATLAKNKSDELQLPTAEILHPEFLRSFLQNINAELGPTAAFVGGRLSEDVINVLGKREQPIQNFALFDGDNLTGRIFSLFTTPPEMVPPGTIGAVDPVIAEAVAAAVADQGMGLQQAGLQQQGQGQEQMTLL